MQIFVKTMDFGTITLDAKASDTIGNVKRNIRKKLESMFEGYGVELWVDASHAFNIIFDGHPLEDDKTLSDYNIQQESTLRFVHGLEGGAPNVRKGWLKKEDAVKVLKMKTVRPVNESIVGTDVQNAIAKIREETAKIKDSDGNFFTSAAKELPAAKIQKIVETFGTHGNDAVRKIIQTLPDISDAYRDIIQAEAFLVDLRMRHEQAVLDAYTDTYVKYDETKGEIQYDNKKFKSDMEDILKEKRGEERILSAIATENHPAPSTSSCSCM